MRVDASYPQLRQHHRVLTRDALTAVYADQAFSVLTVGRALRDEWDRKLAAVILEQNTATAAAIAHRVAKVLGGTVSVDAMRSWLEINARIGAESINAATRANLDAAPDADSRSHVFDVLTGSSVIQHARSMVTTSANFGAHDAARASGDAVKEWIWSGRGPRHQDLAGQRVDIDSVFSNGLKWPGDPAGSADDNADCFCSVAIEIGDA